jgi:RND family efflux transporter MFP subunit
MKTFKYAAGIFIVFAAIVAVLFYNRSKLLANTNNGEITSLPVTVAEASRRQLDETDEVVGTVSANNDVAIVSEAEGKVKEIHAEIGEYKEAGSVLIQIDDELKRAAFNSAEVTYDKSKKDLDRFESLAKEHSVTDEQLEGARQTYQTAEAQYVTAKRQLSDTQVKTPISGVVTARNVDVGVMVLKNTVVANVVDLSRVKIRVNVSEHDAFKVRPNQTASITTDVYPGTVLAGTVYSVSDKADEAHTYAVEVRMVNSKEHPLKAGMFARVGFQTVADTGGVSIPRIALVGSIKSPQVYVVEHGFAKLRNVRAGAEVGNNLQILEGLHEGEQVVVSGQVNLKDSSAVTILK